MYFQKYVSGFKRRPKKGGVFICTFVLLKSTKPGNKSTFFPGTFENQKYKSTKSTKKYSANSHPYFPIMYAYQKQLVYMKHYLKLGSYTVRGFATRLRELNNYLPYFPREKGKPEPCKLSDDELVFILNQAKPEEWQSVILGANIELYQFDFQGTYPHLQVKMENGCWTDTIW